MKNNERTQKYNKNKTIKAMESMNLQTEPDEFKNNEANNQIANPQPAHKLLSNIANLNLLENDSARHKQI